MNEIKTYEAIIEPFEDGRLWVRCAYCGKKAFPVNDDTCIKNLRFKCRDRRCRRYFIVNYLQAHEATQNPEEVSRWQTGDI